MNSGPSSLAGSGHAPSSCHWQPVLLLRADRGVVHAGAVSDEGSARVERKAGHDRREKDRAGGRRSGSERGGSGVRPEIRVSLGGEVVAPIAPG